MKRTTILLDDGLLLDSKDFARRQGMTFTALVHAALREYMEAHWTPRKFAFAGIGRSERSLTVDEQNEILRNEMGRLDDEPPPASRDSQAM